MARVAPRRLLRPACAGIAAATVLAAGAAAQDQGLAQAARAPTQWLQAMDGAFRTLDYDGEFSYYAASHSQRLDLALWRDAPTGRTAARARGGSRASLFARGSPSRSPAEGSTAELAAFRIVHMVIDGVERERIVHLNGPRREVHRTGDQVAYLAQPGDSLLGAASGGRGNGLEIPGAPPSATYARVFARRFETVADYYDISIEGHGRVANRAAVHLRVSPRDADRLGYRLWLDAETGLLLRSELHDPSRANLEIFQFTSLKVGDAVDAQDLASPAGDGWVRVTSTATEASPPLKSPWSAGWVPAGFELTGSTVQSPEGRAPEVSMLTFSDGLAAFSVFVEVMPSTGAGHVMSRNGATVALTYRAASERGEHLVTVVGEVPVATAQRIAASVGR